MKVCKFGGSSLANAEQIRKIKYIIDSDIERIYVVPSAPGKRFDEDTKITDLLIEFYNAVSDGSQSMQIFENISNRYTEIRDGLELKTDIESYLEEIKQAVLSGAGYDYTISRGEYLNSLLIADFLGFDFIDAADVIFFNSEGKYQSDKTRTVMRGRLEHSKTAVIPGFYGSMPNGEIKTFSRGGSDITGAIVARAARADVYENWTDVSGFMMADPRIVKDPKPIKKISYRELRELSYMGASVLHEDAIFPVFKANIPINIKNTNKPDDEGTFIVPKVHNGESDIITGIAGRKGFSVLAIEKTNMNAEIGFGRKVLMALEKNNMSFEHMPSGVDTLSVVLANSEITDKQPQLLDDVYNLCEPDSLEVFKGLALIATVGRGMIHNIGVAARLFSALAKSGVNIRMIDQGSSEINIIVGIDESDFETGIRAIYEEFCG